MLLELQPEVDEVLQPFGHHAVEFFYAIGFGLVFG